MSKRKLIFSGVAQIRNELNICQENTEHLVLFLTKLKCIYVESAPKRACSQSNNMTSWPCHCVRALFDDVRSLLLSVTVVFIDRSRYFTANHIIIRLIYPFFEQLHVYIWKIPYIIIEKNPIKGILLSSF